MCYGHDLEGSGTQQMIQKEMLYTEQSPKATSNPVMNQ